MEEEKEKHRLDSLDSEGGFHPHHGYLTGDGNRRSTDRILQCVIDPYPWSPHRPFWTWSRIVTSRRLTLNTTERVRTVPAPRP